MAIPLDPGVIDEQAGDQFLGSAPPELPEPAPIGPFYHPQDIYRALPANAPPFAGVVPPPFALSERDVMAVQLRLRDLEWDMPTEELNRLSRDFVLNAPPELLDLFWEDANAALTYQSTDEYLQAIGAETAIRDALEWLGAPQEDSGAYANAFLMAAREEMVERYGNVVFAGQLAQSQDAIRGEWEANTAAPNIIEDVSAFIEEEADAIPGLKMRYAKIANVTAEVEEDIARIAGRDATWASLGSDLELEVSDDTGTWTYLVRLDEGTEIKTSADAIIAVISAERGWAHSLDTSSAAAPGSQTFGGKLIEGAIGNTTRWVERHGFAPVSRLVQNNFDKVLGAAVAPSAGLTGARVVADAVEVPTEEQKIAETKAMLEEVQASTVSTESTALGMARAIASDPTNVTRNEFEVAAGMILAAPEMVDEQVANLPDITNQQAIDYITEQEEEKGILAGTFEERIVAPALVAAEWWDHAVHYMGIGLLETIETLGPILNPAFLPTSLALGGNPLDPNSTLAQGLDAALQGNVAESFGVFKSAYDEALENNSVAEYLNIDPNTSFGQWTNLAASVAFDPITWLVPGGKASWKWMEEMASNPAMATRYIKQAHIQSWARQVVTRTGDDAALLLFEGLDTMDSSLIRRLTKIAATEYPDRASRKAALREVSEALEDGLRNSTWLPSLPARVVTRRNREGIGRIFRRYGQMGQTERNRVAKMLYPASRTRNAALTEREFLSQAADIITWGGVDVAGEWNKVLNLWDEVTDPVARNQYLAALAQKQKSLGDQINDLARGLSPEARDVAKLRQLRARAAQQLDDATRRGATGTQEFVDEIRRLDIAIERYGDEWDAYQEAIKPLRAEVAESSRLAKHATEAQPVTKLEEWIHDYYDRWGRRIGLDELDEVNPFLSDGRKMLDWEKVHGDPKYRLTTTEVRDYNAWGRGADTEAMHASGLGAHKGSTLLPASPVEIIAYEALPESQRAAWNALLRQNAVAEALSGTLTFTQSVFSASVLLNPLTALRTHLDEVLRFYEQTGQTARSLRTLLPRMFEKGNTMVPRTDIGRNIGLTPVGPESRAFTRGATNPNAKARPFSWASPKDKGFAEATERFVNGNMLNDDVFKQYARAVSGSTSSLPGPLREIAESVDDFVFHGGTRGRGQIEKGLEHGGLSRDIQRSLGFTRDTRGDGGFLAVFRKSDLPDEALDILSRQDIEQFLTPAQADELRAALNTDDLSQVADLILSADQPLVPTFILSADDAELLVKALAGEVDEAAARRLFRDWWDTEGFQLRRRTTVRGRPVDADYAFDTAQATWGVVTDGVIDAKLADDIFRAAAEGRKLPGENLAWTRGWKGQVPTQDVTKTWKRPGDWLDNAFDHLYGNPSTRRGSIMHDYYYDFAQRLYSRRFQGRVITPEWVAEKYGIDMADAVEMVRQGNRNTRIREVMESGGMILQKSLDDSAARWAAKNADSLMYQMTSVSAFGKKVQRFYPYGRAQTDYIQYWMNRMFSPTLIRNPFKGLEIGTIGAGGRALPLNLRVVDRLGKLMANVNQEDPFADPGHSPEWALNTFSFVPDQWDGFAIQDAIVPAPGPLPSWAINWLPEDHPIREAFSAIHPAHGIFNDYTNSGLEGFANLIDAVVPESSRSLRGQADTLARLYMAATGRLTDDPAEFNRIAEARRVDAEGPYQREFAGQLTAEWFTAVDPETGIANVFAFSPANGKDPTLPSWQAVTKIINDAAIAGYDKDVFERLRRMVGLPGHYGTDQLYAAHYAGVSGMLDSWVAQGFVTESQAADFRASEQQVSDWLNDGNADSGDIVAYADVARDILEFLPDDELAKFLILNPNAAINFVSQYEVDPTLVPEEWQDAVSGGRIVAIGQAGRDARDAGRDQGWILTRPMEQVASDRHKRVHQAVRDYIRFSYEELTGLRWDQPLAPKDRTKPNYAGNVGTVAADWEGWEILESTGFEIPDEWRQPDGTISATLGELRGAFDGHRDQFVYSFELDNDVEVPLKKLDGFADTDLLRRAAEDQGWDGDFTSDVTLVAYYGSGLFDDMNRWISEVERNTGWASPSEWDEDFVTPNGQRLGDVKEDFRFRFSVAVALNREFSEDTYDAAGLNRQFGDLNWEPPQPPPLSELEFRFDAPIGNVTVVDGDTIAVDTKDGPLRFRLLGVNTPEDGQLGAADAHTALKRFLENHPDNISIGIFQPSLYGTTQEFRAVEGDAVVERTRVFGWLYVDGVPIFDVSQFTASNPRGVGIGGEVPDFEAMLNEALGRSES